MKGVMTFCRRGKFSPMFIGPFEILRQVGEMAYEVSSPLTLSSVHPMFHVTMLRQYVPNVSHVLQWESVQLDETLSFEEQLVAILDMHVRQLRSKEILSVNVQ
ncbi:hypothetical protein MTR67_018367 [Solanum verrucosum]|uniref:Tf2-1-like SH3-like domain-containing protein n=1 Tax=Solanum verrucosum TaxID=315347 RepID=A0AAF0TLI8_SOLVR|nr:hypothetical protein MTR67_018367 [Solanum verrucosum]